MYTGLYEVNGGSWGEPCFSLLEAEVTDKQEQETRMIHMVRISVGSSVRTQVSLDIDTGGYIQGIFVVGCIYTGYYTLIYLVCQLRE